ncbi:hypothetical protein VIGAN_11006900 [Vigna angularis var. angularis]|uniref:Uncharacterized protein n=1 Tax=Vigna angularis var. angularis TaxID=157739 RepID=A0A0S3T7P5_PHAAN|nr:hypothetical protein VIGAN_11006900 [Vigna angularis var. angularis]
MYPIHNHLNPTPSSSIIQKLITPAHRIHSYRSANIISNTEPSPILCIFNHLPSTIIQPRPPLTPGPFIIYL